MLTAARGRCQANGGIVVPCRFYRGGIVHTRAELDRLGEFS